MGQTPYLPAVASSSQPSLMWAWLTHVHTNVGVTGMYRVRHNYVTNVGVTGTCVRHGYITNVGVVHIINYNHTYY